MSTRPAPSFIILFMGLMVIVGACNTIFNKLMISTPTNGGSFDHYFFSTFMMFVGETFCYIAFKIYEMRKGNDLTEQLTSDDTNTTELAGVLPPIKPWVLALPALCDFFGSTIMSFSLIFLPSSVYQMTRGSIMIFVAILSRVFLKSKVYRHQIFALTSIFIGIGLVGISSISNSDDSQSTDTNNDGMVIIGFVGLIIAQLFSASQFVVEEKICMKYEVHPLQMVGWEGIWGSILYMIVLVIFYFIDCENGNKICYSYIDDDGIPRAKLDNWILAFRQMADNAAILIFSIMYICCISAYNYLGITITKYVSSPARAVMDNARTVLIWAFCLFPFWSNTENYKKLREYFDVLELIGFIFLIFGTLVYNEFVTLPFMGLDKFTKSNLEKLKTQQNEEQVNNT